MNDTPEFDISTARDDDFFSATGKLRPIWCFLISVIVVVVANMIAGKTAFTAFGRHPLVADAAYRMIAMLLLVGAFALMLRYLDKLQGDVLAGQGLPLRRKAGAETLKGFLLGFFLVALAVGAIAVFGDLRVDMTVNSVTARRAAVVVVLLLAGAMLEEVMFRGYPFQRLVEAMGPWGAILVLSVLFGAVHLQNPNAGGVLSWGFFNTIAVGVLLALAYLRSGELWMPFGFHFAWNFALGVVFGLPVSGLSMFSVVVRSHATGSKLLTGGNYGIESSLTGAVVIVLGILIVLLAIPTRVENSGLAESERELSERT